MIHQYGQTEERINPKDGAVMVYIPEGESLMGDDDDDLNYAKPQHKVYLDGYWIYKYPVTVGQYRQFCEEIKHKMPPTPDWGWKDDHPVVNVTWHDANAYCEWVGSDSSGFSASRNVRLPTEAEWEKAARGTSGRKYPWGDEWDASRCNSWEKGPHQTTPVGSYPQGASPYGVQDMAGNVWEWCEDWYAENYYINAPNWNPKGPEAKKYRTLRGGSWRDGYPILLRAAYRYWAHPGNWWSIRGFRCVYVYEDFR